MVQEFTNTVQQHAVNIGGDVMTYAEELYKEGESKGEIKGKVETIEGLLAVGVSWAVITQATGIDRTQFEALKIQLRQLTSDDDMRPNPEMN